MLSDDAKKLFNAICTLSGDSDVYQVLDAEELLQTARLPLSAEDLGGLMSELRSAKLVDIKYSTAQRYCLMPIKRTLTVSDDDEDIAGEVRVGRGGRTNRVFWAAFLGSALGSLVVGIIVILIVIFVRV